jgi:hypothetical protein
VETGVGRNSLAVDRTSATERGKSNDFPACAPFRYDLFNVLGTAGTRFPPTKHVETFLSKK